jgi:hypothetical protein
VAVADDEVDRVVAGLGSMLYILFNKIYLFDFKLAEKMGKS